MMLRDYKKVEYLDVVAPPNYHNHIDEIRRFLFQPIDGTLRLLGMKSEIVFLSVVMPAVEPIQKIQRVTTPSPSRQLPRGLDQYVLSIIFGFAASQMFRKIYFRKIEDDDFDILIIEPPL